MKVYIVTKDHPYIKEGAVFTNRGGTPNYWIKGFYTSEVSLGVVEDWNRKQYVMLMSEYEVKGVFSPVNIRAVVCNTLGVGELSAIRGKPTKEETNARRICSYLLKDLASLSPYSIAAFLHSHKRTIDSYLQNFKTHLRFNKELREAYNKVKKELNKKC